MKQYKCKQFQLDLAWAKTACTRLECGSKKLSLRRPVIHLQGKLDYHFDAFTANVRSVLDLPPLNWDIRKSDDQIYGSMIIRPYEDFVSFLVQWVKLLPHK